MEHNHEGERKIMVLSKWGICWFHVSLPGCKGFLESYKDNNVSCSVQSITSWRDNNPALYLQSIASAALSRAHEYAGLVPFISDKYLRLFDVATNALAWTADDVARATGTPEADDHAVDAFMMTEWLPGELHDWEGFRETPRLWRP